MQLKDKVRVQHMLDASRKAVAFCAGLSEADFVKDEKLSLAVVRLMEIIGEAAKNISHETRQNYPEIPWKEIAGTRDRLIHGYFNVDLGILGNIVKQDLPKLIPTLERMLAE